MNNGLSHVPPVAVIGCGAWGINLVRNFKELGALQAVCDPSEISRIKAQKVAPGTLVFKEVEDVINSDVRGVIVATPPDTHQAIALALLESGKDVFVEKPLALTYRQGLELVEAAERNARILMVGHVLEYHPAILKVRSMIRAGEIGDLNYIYSNRLSLGRVRREENILWSFAPHDTAIILRLTGSMPTQVSASGGAFLRPDIFDVTVTHLSFDNGVRAHIHVSWLHPFKEQRLVVIGSDGMFTYDDVRKQLVLYNYRTEPERSEGAPVQFEAAEPLRLECKAFLDAMTSRRPPLTDGPSALRVLKVLEAGQESLAASGVPTILT